MDTPPCTTIIISAVLKLLIHTVSDEGGDKKNLDYYHGTISHVINTMYEQPQHLAEFQCVSRHDFRTHKLDMNGQ